jgi:phospholipase/carboxylesterase
MPRTDLSWRTVRPAEGFYTSLVEAADRYPVRTFLPTGYEPNYPYPLLVFMHGHGGNEEQALRLAPRVSRRNYVSIGLRGPLLVGVRPDGRGCFSWGADGQAGMAAEDYVFRAVEQTRRHYHVHSERIYLAGVCEGATMAYRFALAYPDKVAGVIALNGLLPRTGPVFRFSRVRGLKVFMGHGIANAVAPLALARRDAKLLYTAGVDVTLNTYTTTHRLHPQMLTDANRWVMEQITGDEL